MQYWINIWYQSIRYCINLRYWVWQGSRWRVIIYWHCWLWYTMLVVQWLWRPSGMHKVTGSNLDLSKILLFGFHVHRLMKLYMDDMYVLYTLYGHVCTWTCMRINVCQCICMSEHVMYMSEHILYCSELYEQGCTLDLHDIGCTWYIHDLYVHSPSGFILWILKSHGVIKVIPEEYQSVLPCNLYIQCYWA